MNFTVLMEAQSIAMQRHARSVVDSWKLTPKPVVFLQLEKHPEIDGIHIQLTIRYRGQILDGSRVIDPLEAHRGKAKLLLHIKDQFHSLLDDLKLALEVLSP